MSAPRLPWTTLAPAQYKSMAGVSQALTTSTVGHALLELVKTRVSQINGCAFCLDMHARALRHSGETWNRLTALPAWRETDAFTAKERAALAWAESVTRLADNHAERDAEFDALREHFNDQEIVELTWAVAVINGWNRMAVSMRMPADDKPMA